METKLVDEVTPLRRLAIVGAGRQAIEGNPLTDEEIIMFEMFDREGWSHERRLAYISDLISTFKPAAQ